MKIISILSLFFQHVLSLFYFRSMKRFVELILVVVFFLVSLNLLFAQPAKPVTKQTVKPKPLAKPTKDSLPKQPVNATGIPQKDSVIAFQADSWQLYTNTAGEAKQDVWLINKPVKRSSTDYIFYLLALLFLILGSIRFLFPKYFNDLFGLFFRVTFKQKAIRERLLESTLPSMLLNGLFFISGGFFLYVISGYYHWQIKGNFWYGLGFWTVILTLVYGLKWLLLRIIGWLFQMQEASNTYTFIVFLVNKVLGVMLLPVVVLMSLAPVSLHPALVTIVLFLLSALFIYRYIISYPGIKASVRVNQFHFFLYLCAFEIVPLLIIYKGLAMRLSSAT
jgi:ABC-type multidrug transport system fused ATPase/permease subunit